ncbi:metal-dependent hydrolase family protein [Pseudolysinimonas kribbensis]|uniref:metal-dependent hydrolase family protein n=1 Tax=Pseudolysinimonas kribbensis TaxID=433641 RepID=UPI0024E0B7C2|nr:amidohydrolase family protein [Pseudolysinimonas kribbensis]
MPNGLLITDALLFDGESAELVETDIRIADGRIAELGRGIRADVPTIAAAGRVVGPGLTDAHFHAYAVGLHSDEIEAMPLSYVALAGATRLRQALARGFTRVRDVAGGDAGLALALERGHLVAPRYLYTGPALSQTGGHGDPRTITEPWAPRPGGYTEEVVDGVDALRRAVRERFRMGAHAIKIMTSGGVVSYTDPLRVPQYSPEEVRAVTDEAARRGRYVAAHAYSPEAIVHSIDNGVRSIEHGNLLDAATARRMAGAGAVLIPTLAAYDAMDRRGAAMGLAAVSQAKNREVLDAGKHAIRHALDAGVAVGWGSDLMGDLADDQLVGVRLQAEVMGALGTLRAMIRTNAELFGTWPEGGPTAVGAEADLVVWDGNPVEDLSVVWDESRPRTVILGGRVVGD